MNMAIVRRGGESVTVVWSTIITHSYFMTAEVELCIAPYILHILSGKIYTILCYSCRWRRSVLLGMEQIWPGTALPVIIHSANYVYIFWYIHADYIINIYWILYASFVTPSNSLCEFALLPRFCDTSNNKSFSATPFIELETCFMQVTSTAWLGWCDRQEHTISSSHGDIPPAEHIMRLVAYIGARRVSHLIADCT